MADHSAEYAMTVLGRFVAAKSRHLVMAAGQLSRNREGVAEGSGPE
jgi:hypothetical protein